MIDFFDRFVLFQFFDSKPKLLKQKNRGGLKKKILPRLIETFFFEIARARISKMLLFLAAVVAHLLLEHTSVRAVGESGLLLCAYNSWRWW